jgi:hypothetical protein
LTSAEPAAGTTAGVLQPTHLRSPTPPAKGHQ